MPRNEESWHEIYDLPMFADADSELGKRVWKWAETLRAADRLRQVDLIALHALLRDTYEIGKQDGAEE